MARVAIFVVGRMDFSKLIVPRRFLHEGSKLSEFKELRAGRGRIAINERNNNKLLAKSLLREHYLL